MFEHEGAPCVIDGARVDVYSDALGKSVELGRVPECAVSTRSFALSCDHIDSVTTCNGFIVSVGISERTRSNEAGTGVRVSSVVATIETEGGVVLRSSDVIYSTTETMPVSNAAKIMRVELASYSTWILAFITERGSLTMRCFAFDTNAPLNGWVSVTNAFGDVLPDCAPKAVGAGDKVFVTYYSTVDDVNSFIAVKAITAAGILYSGQVSVTGGGSSSVWGIAIDYDSAASLVWVSHGVQGVIFIDAFNSATLGSPSLSRPVGGHIVNPSAKCSLFLNTSNASSKRLFWSCAGAAGGYPVGYTGSVQLSVSSGQIVVSATSYMPNVYMASNAAWRSNRLYALMCQPAASYLPTGLGFTEDELRTAILRKNYRLGTAVVCDITDGLTLGWGRPVAVAHNDLTMTVCSSPVVSTNTISFVYGIETTVKGQTAKVVSCEFESARYMRRAKHNGTNYFSGGLLSYFDGQSVSEVGFLTRPPKVQSVLQSPGSIPEGVVSYVMTWEYIDALGNILTSGVSNPLTLEANDSQFKLLMPGCGITAKRALANDTRIRTVLWRTDPGSSAPYRLAAEFENRASNVVFDASVASTYVDNVPSYEGNRLLYGTGSLPGTNGAAQNRSAPPYADHVVSYNGMIVIASGGELWYSGQTISGEGAWFSPLFTTPIDGGDVTGLAAFDGTLYAFTRTNVYAVAGEPPSDNAAVGGLGTPRRLAVDVGCVNARSIVVCGLGVFFQSENGIELLDRSGSVRAIGRAVQETLAAYPVITSAVIDDVNALVRFTLAQSESGGVVSGQGVDLVFDLARNQWQSVDRKTGLTSNQASQAACMVRVAGVWRYAWLGSDGTVFYERTPGDASAYLDGATWITMAAETGFLKLGGIQGRHHVNKVLLLASKSSRADLKTLLTYDYASEPKAVMVRGASAIDALATSIGRVQVEHQLHNEAEGVAVKVRFEDSTPTGGVIGNGRGASWISVAFEGVPREGATALPSGGM
jgi:hypothetical protein